MERKKGTLILTVCLESHGESDELRVSSDQQRSCERARLSRSSDIFPVLQVKTQTKERPISVVLYLHDYNVWRSKSVNCDVV